MPKSAVVAPEPLQEVTESPSNAHAGQPIDGKGQHASQGHGQLQPPHPTKEVPQHLAALWPKSPANDKFTVYGLGSYSEFTTSALFQPSHLLHPPPLQHTPAGTNQPKKYSKSAPQFTTSHPHTLQVLVGGNWVLLLLLPYIAATALQDTHLQLGLLIATAISGGLLLVGVGCWALNWRKVYPHVLEVAMLVTFGVLLGVSYTDDKYERTIQRLFNFIASGSLAGITLCSLLLWPAGTQHAQELVLRVYMGHPAVKRAGRITTAVLSLTLLAACLIYLVPYLVDNAYLDHWSLLNIALRLVAPCVLVALGLLFVRVFPVLYMKRAAPDVMQPLPKMGRWPSTMVASPYGGNLNALPTSVEPLLPPPPHILDPAATYKAAKATAAAVAAAGEALKGHPPQAAAAAAWAAASQAQQQQQQPHLQRPAPQAARVSVSEAGTQPLEAAHSTWTVGVEAAARAPSPADGYQELQASAAPYAGVYVPGAGRATGSATISPREAYLQTFSPLNPALELVGAATAMHGPYLDPRIYGDLLEAAVTEDSGSEDEGGGGGGQGGGYMQSPSEEGEDDTTAWGAGRRLPPLYFVRDNQMYTAVLRRRTAVAAAAGTSGGGLGDVPQDPRGYASQGGVGYSRGPRMARLGKAPRYQPPPVDFTPPPGMVPDAGHARPSLQLPSFPEKPDPAVVAAAVVAAAAAAGAVAAAEAPLPQPARQQLPAFPPKAAPGQVSPGAGQLPEVASQVPQAAGQVLPAAAHAPEEGSPAPSTAAPAGGNAANASGPAAATAAATAGAGDGPLPPSAADESSAAAQRHARRGADAGRKPADAQQARDQGTKMLQEAQAVAEDPAQPDAKQQLKVFQDAAFPADFTSIIEIERDGKVHRGPAIDQVVEWRRLKDLSCFPKGQKVLLFEDGIQPSDVNQGNLGDCWLLSSLASLATSPGALEQVFLTKEYNEEGRYKLRMWSAKEQRFTEVVVDDRIPVWKATGAPCFAKPSGNEGWVLLLEKAMAKFVGNYALLDQNSATWALEALTGLHVTQFAFKETHLPSGEAAELYPPARQADPATRMWVRGELKAISKDHKGGQQPGHELVMQNDAPHSWYASEDVFQLVAYHLQLGDVLTAATVEGSDREAVHGLLKGHAYSLIGSAELPASSAGRLRMLQLRNPHGNEGGEWNGPWSDTSGLWAQHSGVAQALGWGAASRKANDSVFWIELADFLQHFSSVICCSNRPFDFIPGEDVARLDAQAFSDPDFPHDHRSLAGFEVQHNGVMVSKEQLEEPIEWKRLWDIGRPEMFRRGVLGLKLFSGGITPDDIDGENDGLGAAMACVANKAGAIEEIFLSRSNYEPSGRYSLRLYDPAAGTVQLVTIDDWVPCWRAAGPISGLKLLGQEVWPLLIEKAVAKLLGTYEPIAAHRVSLPWALACLTASQPKLFERLDDKADWRRERVTFNASDASRYFMKFFKDDIFDWKKMFDVLCYQLQLGAVAGMTVRSGGGYSPFNGLEEGGCYSVLQARLVDVAGKPTRLIKLRHAGRSAEWTGPWCDGSQLWRAHPGVARELGYVALDPEVARADGAFWMPWDDACFHFQFIFLAGDSLPEDNQQGEWSPPSAAELAKAAKRQADYQQRQQRLAEQEKAAAVQPALQRVLKGYRDQIQQQQQRAQAEAEAPAVPSADQGVDADDAGSEGADVAS